MAHPLHVNSLRLKCSRKNYNQPIHRISRFKRFVFLVGFSILLIILFNSVAFGQAELLKDLNGAYDWNTNEDHYLTDGGSRMYYFDQHDLWTSDGTSSGTVKLKSFSWVTERIMVGNILYFSANDGVSGGQELWKSEGTVGGTVMVKDIFPGDGESAPTGLCNVNGKLFFSASNGSHGRELWSSDGTSAGTVMVRDILNGLGNSNPTSLTNMNGTVYFSANDASRGYELWKSDGTPAGTSLVKDIRTGSKASSSPKLLTNVNGTLYFTATDNTTGAELWKSNGTIANTVRVQDIRIGLAGAQIENLIDVNGTLFFTANNGIHGDELWKSDGTLNGTRLVKDLNPGSTGSNNTGGHGVPMHAFTNINGLLYFVASKGRDYFIYRSDGTETGTRIVEPAFGVGINPPHPAFTYRNGKVYFFNMTETHGQYFLWEMPFDGIDLNVVHEFTPSDDYYHRYRQEMINFGGNLYTFGRFPEAPTWLGEPFQFIRSDGTWDGTVALLKIETGKTLGSNPQELIKINDLMYIRTLSDLAGFNHKGELYRTDGTTEGTIKIMDMPEGNQMIASGSRLIFGSENASGMAGLYATEGTPETTVLLSQPDQIPSVPQNLTDVDGTIYYSDWYNYSGQTYANFWKSDGTPEGTRALIRGFTEVNSITRVVGKVIFITTNPNGNLWLWKTINVGVNFVAEIPSGGSRKTLHHPIAVSDLVMYFVANDGVHGNEIWRTDGYPAGTYMLFDHNTADPTDFQAYEDDIRHLTTMRKVLYFSAQNEEGVWGLYSTTGNSSWQKIVDMPPVVYSVVQHGKMYLFTQQDNNSHYQFWVSDGTAAGTRFLTDIEGWGAIDHTFIDRVLYFNAQYGDKIMRSDGTPCGTYAINTGVNYAFPVEALGTSVIFGAHTEATRMEPFIYRNIPAAPAGPCSTSLAVEMNSVLHEETNSEVTPYPNPFTNEFTLRVNGKDDVAVQMTVLNAYGEQVLRLDDLNSNTDYEHIGAGWKSGLYVLRVYKDGKITTHHLVKK